MGDKYYLQDSRQCVGNAVLWWQLGGGYCCSIENAELFTKEEAINQNKSRETDIPWPEKYIANRLKTIVDMQCINSKEALSDTDIMLYKKPKPRFEPHNCSYCGCFCNEYQFFNGCPKCGETNSY